MALLIVVPARYGSTRLPGKPLREIAGVPMLLRTARNAQDAADALEQAEVVVATDDARIEAFCAEHALPCVMTSADLATGSDRALAAANALDPDTARIDRIVNLQGDAPFTPAGHITRVARELGRNGADAATAYVQLDWDALDALREHKQTAPFSGTTLIEDADGFAVWFSKAIIPAIRKEEAHRAEPLSPVKRHIGLYGYRRDVLARFAALPESRYERLEGLEQLRLLEAGYRMACARVERPRISLGGIDTQADIDLAERLIAEHGDPFSGGPHRG